MRAVILFVIIAIASACHAATPKLHFEWKQIDYTWDSPESRSNAIKEKRYIPENNLPLAIAPWKKKIFLSVPRWRTGVVSSLNYIDMDGPKDQLLKPYPSFKDNFVSDTATDIPTNRTVISAYRMYVDTCDRLWVLDSGVANSEGAANQIARSSLVIFDLKTDQLVRRHTFEKDIVKENFLVANLAVDVTKDTCDNAYAYVCDTGGKAIVVYNLKEDASWRITHHYFHFDPVAGSYNVSGVKFRWDSGIIAIALSEPKEDGYRTVYLHALSSTKEFFVSTKVLQNYRSLDKDEAFDDFKLLGDRGKNTQSTSNYYEPKTQVLFYTQLKRNGVACWNSNKPFTEENNVLLFSDPELYDFTNDLRIDDEGTVWVMVNKVPRFLYGKMDYNIINYRIYGISATEAIRGTACQQGGEQYRKPL